MSSPPEKSAPQIWDPALRAFHWLLVLAVVGGWLLGQFGPLKMTLHFYAGYTVIGLLAFRLIWGLIGPANARFAQFVKGPKAVLAYLRTLPARAASHSDGHNPLGGLSVVAMLLVLVGQVGTGLIIDPEDYINIGPLADSVSTSWNRWALGWHHRLGVLLLILVVLHVGAILFYRFWKREDLVTPMITGRRKER
ncbi:cytochrome b/b6 domain-containing protein [Sedimentimonas flavescens]|uniref:cytochrome b/b6 domain-containing protein n=1 Tax=Sedimentimonas flavescens TaxID=2851012 RepID=UPI001C49F69D|nr:cytochrome b/b6 domain-containing protein [Sedimentimonas flavescens]MBW0156595.1 cytochrome b/b6 domain-containing protein [Sedimentimonas flavescens]